MINAYWEPLDFALPALPTVAQGWQALDRHEPAFAL